MPEQVIPHRMEMCIMPEMTREQKRERVRQRVRAATTPENYTYYPEKENDDCLKLDSPQLVVNE